MFLQPPSIISAFYQCGKVTSACCADLSILCFILRMESSKTLYGFRHFFLTFKSKLLTHTHTHVVYEYSMLQNTLIYLVNIH